MSHQQPPRPPHLVCAELPAAQRLTERTLLTLERFLHIEAVSGIALLLAAAIALLWANSPQADSYHTLWQQSLTLGMSDWQFSRSLHFWVNDGLMTFFFLVVGMEIRREMHEGALSQLREAALPVAAAFGGVLMPALLYLLFNHEPGRSHGWAVPTATDIAFAVGVLALLGRSIPGPIRIFLLTMAITDDIIAVVIIALFYSGGLDYHGFIVAGGGLLWVLMLQQMGIGNAWAYVAPSAVVWLGLLLTGAHPGLAGVVLGLITPVHTIRLREHPADTVWRIGRRLSEDRHLADPEQLVQPLRQLRLAQREMLPPVTRVQMALHPWVAFGIMPLFAFANAGISLDGLDLAADDPRKVMFGVMLALVFGKPLGVTLISWLGVRLGLCRLPAGVGWGGILLIGLLAGIGFTMAIFVSMLAFADAQLMNAAKLGVLLGSLCAAVLGLGWGVVYVRRLRCVPEAS
ncbi:MAG: Na+/H+ antiporter NhaA [Sterolibacterium sp.]|nr:Na+/H+ antiporter NhaA [Sterolibacterium sp.]